MRKMVVHFLECKGIWSLSPLTPVMDRRSAVQMTYAWHIVGIVAM